MLLYWISYIWLTAHRGKMPGDPVEFATSDRTSRILILLMAATAVVALLDRFHYLRDFIGRPVDDEALETLTTMIHRAVFAPVD